jgi:hypothetical protein
MQKSAVHTRPSIRGGPNIIGRKSMPKGVLPGGNNGMSRT